MRAPRILVMSGSTRSGSYNTRLAAVVGKSSALAGAEVVRISLADYPLPIYDGDLELNRGVPQHAQLLKSLFLEQDGIFIACPEYNAGITPVLKNAIDWISRASVASEPPGAAFKNRVFALGAASPGGFGGMRGLIAMRTIMEVGLGADVLPQMVVVPGAKTGFDTKDELTDERVDGQLQSLVRALVRRAQHLATGR